MTPKRLRVDAQSEEQDVPVSDDEVGISSLPADVIGEIVRWMGEDQKFISRSIAHSFHHALPINTSRPPAIPADISYYCGALLSCPFDDAILHHAAQCGALDLVPWALRHTRATMITRKALDSTLFPALVVAAREQGFPVKELVEIAVLRGDYETLMMLDPDGLYVLTGTRVDHKSMKRPTTDGHRKIRQHLLLLPDFKFTDVSFKRPIRRNDMETLQWLVGVAGVTMRHFPDSVNWPSVTPWWRCCANVAPYATLDTVRWLCDHAGLVIGPHITRQAALYGRRDLVEFFLGQGVQCDKQALAEAAATYIRGSSNRLDLFRHVVDVLPGTITDPEAVYDAVIDGDDEEVDSTAHDGLACIQHLRERNIACNIQLLFNNMFDINNTDVSIIAYLLQQGARPTANHLERAIDSTDVRRIDLLLQYGAPMPTRPATLATEDWSNLGWFDDHVDQFPVASLDVRAGPVWHAAAWAYDRGVEVYHQFDNHAGWFREVVSYFKGLNTWDEPFVLVNDGTRLRWVPRLL